MATAAAATAFEHRIYLCMGRSCMRGGNVENLHIIRNFLDQHRVAASVRPMGHLCEGQCNQGPSLILDGTLYHSVDPQRMRALLETRILSS